MNQQRAKIGREEFEKGNREMEEFTFYIDCNDIWDPHVQFVHAFSAHSSLHLYIHIDHKKAIQLSHELIQYEVLSLSCLQRFYHMVYNSLPLNKPNLCLL